MVVVDVIEVDYELYDYVFDVYEVMGVDVLMFYFELYENF